jgi:Putative Flp pilus-assembly TadE/G-like
MIARKGARTVPAQKNGEGQILIFFALMFMGLMFAVGLVLDGSFAWVKQREAQNAADFAAIAGANSLRAGNISDATILATITSVVQKNGGGVQTAVYTDLKGNPYTPAKIVGSIGGSQSDLSSFGGVQVVATRGWTPFFPALWGGSTANAGASGTARFTSSNSLCALCAISETISPALSLTSGTVVNVPQGSVVSNDNANVLSGGKLVLADPTATIHYSGVATVSGNSTVTPAPVPQSKPIDDPYKNLLDPILPSGTPLPDPNVKNSTQSILPGFYESLSVSGPPSQSTVLNLQPGTYYVKGTEKNGTWTGVDCGSNASITGTGVTIILFNQAPFTQGSGCTLNLTAPTACPVTAPATCPKDAAWNLPTTAIPYPGMLIYAVRTNTAIIGLYSGSTTTVDGSIYAMAGNLTMKSGSTSTTVMKTMVVVGTITFGSNVVVSIAYDPSVNMPPFIPKNTNVQLVQ